jgi:cyclic pyranopterin phosphate synthase
MDGATTERIVQNATAKGDVLATARVAGIQAAKRTADLLPMCQTVAVGTVVITFAVGEAAVEVTAEVHTVDRTGVEMEAMTACTVAALTIYDMCKSVDRSMTIETVQLIEKSGGRSGTWRRDLLAEFDLG